MKRRMAPRHINECDLMHGEAGRRSTDVSLLLTERNVISYRSDKTPARRILHSISRRPDDIVS